MIEILYATGIRVSELVGLKLSSLYEKENFIFVTGKGNKERLVPVDQNTLSTIGKYLNCLLYTSPSPRDRYGSRMPSSA